MQPETLVTDPYPFQPLKGTNGRSDSSYPQWEPTINIVAYLFVLWINRTILSLPVPRKPYLLSHSLSRSEGLPNKLKKRA